MKSNVRKSLVHTTLKKFFNGVFTLRTHQISVHTVPEKSENAIISGGTKACVYHMIIKTSFLKTFVAKMFFLHTKTQSLFWFEERFWKAPFSVRINGKSRPNRRNKAALRWSNTAFNTCVSFNFFSKTLDPLVTKLKNGRKQVNNTNASFLIVKLTNVLLPWQHD